MNTFAAVILGALLCSSLQHTDGELTSTAQPSTMDDFLRVSGSGFSIVDSIIIRVNQPYLDNNDGIIINTAVLQFITEDLNVDPIEVVSLTRIGNVDGDGVIVVELLLTPDEIQALVDAINAGSFDTPFQILSAAVGATNNGVTLDISTGSILMGTPEPMDRGDCDDDSTTGKKGKKSKKGANCKSAKSQTSAKSGKSEKSGKSKKSKKSKKSSKGRQTVSKSFMAKPEARAWMGIALVTFGVATVAFGSVYGRRYLARRGMERLPEQEVNNEFKVDLEVTPLLIVE